MDVLVASLRRERATRLLLPLFVLSGATGLVYQVIWARELQVVFGASTFAIATVLAAFMAGLAIGGQVMGRYADRMPRPILVYGGLEAFIALYGLSFPTILGALEGIYLAAWQGREPSPLLFGGLQALLLGAALVIPTACMGATLPLLARFVTDRLGAAADRVGTLYAANTVGAVLGVAVAAFLLLPTLGLWRATVVIAGVNVVLALAAAALDRWSTGAEEAEVEADVTPAPAAWRGAVIQVAFLSGLAALIYEVAFTRILGLVLGTSVYAFATMLIAFLVGIALGGRWGGPLADRWLARGPYVLLLGLATVQAGAAAVAWGLLFVLPELPYTYVRLFEAFSVQRSPGAAVAIQLLLAGVVMTPPAVLLGATFPVAVRAVTREAGAVGRAVGDLYAVNTWGAVLGALTAGFLLVPLVGLRHAVLVGAAINLLAAVRVAFVLLPVRRALAGGAGAVAAVALGGTLALPPWEPLWMTAATHHYVSQFRDYSRQGVRRWALGPHELVYYAEGPASVVTVGRNQLTGNLWLANDGKVDASTQEDLETQILLGLLPLAQAERHRDTLIIGLASGITAGAVGRSDQVEHLEIVELEPAVVQAARYFGPYAHHILDDSRTRVVVQDGRNHLIRAPEARWDVVISEPPNPWIRGVSSLFTREFFELGRTRLAPGGVWCQWVQLYGLEVESLKSILKTFADVHPHVLLYQTANRSDLILLGSEAPLDPLRTLELVGVHPDELARVGLDDEAELLALYLMDGDAIRAWAADAPLHTDDDLRIEYAAPRAIHRPTFHDNHLSLMPFLQVPAVADPALLAALAETYHERNDWVRALPAMRQAALAVGTEDPRGPLWADRARRWEAELRAHAP